ncbi:MAG: DNA-3-methyladenine glycosylase 2 family protein [Ilumatobacteraceae bacterium]
MTLALGEPPLDRSRSVAPPSLPTTLVVYRFGSNDPTTRLAGSRSTGEFWRATHTPYGTATLHLRWQDGVLAAEAWGDGREWLLHTVPALSGQLDQPVSFATGHPAVLRAQHNHPGLRLGASSTLYHELLPVILGQRITAGEAISQWHALVRRLGVPAPGPNPDLMVQPHPDAVTGHPAWWYHQFGVEAKRAEALRTVAKHAARLWEWSTISPADCAAKLALLPGIGRWTIGSALGPSLGDPDALAIGDFHLKNAISHALTGRPRGTDEQMVALLEPYAGQRGRVVRLLLLDGHQAPKFGPRQRILPMRRW